MLFIRKTTYLSGMALAVMLLTVSARANADVMPMDVEPPREVASRRELKKELSSLSVTLETSELELGDFLNRVTPRELYKGAGRAGGVTTHVVRNGPIQVRAADNFIHLTVPVSFTMGYGVFESLPLATKLTFKLTASVSPDWMIITEVYYTGLSEQLADEVGVGLVSIKLRSIVEGVTQPLQRTLSGLITKRLNEKFQLRSEMAKVWQAAQKPMLVDARYAAWLLLTPQEASIYPLYAQHRQIRLGVGLKTYAELVVGPEPVARPATALPRLRQVAVGERSFQVALNIDIVYQDFLKVVAPLLINKEFKGDGRTVVVKSLDLYGNGDRLVVKLETTGDLDGVIYLTCRPVLNPRTNVVSVEDLDFDLQTRNMLLKTAEWFLHGTIRDSIQEKLNLDLTQRLLQVRDMASKALTRVKLADKLYLSGNVTTVSLNDVLVRQDRFSIQVYTAGESSVVLH
ncbi:MAG: DUF4403 family protein [Trichlorobacter sp.]|jgi:hypothetical protein